MPVRTTLLTLPLLLGACAYESKQAPVSTTNGITPASQMPQPVNSLPLGSAVDTSIDRGSVNSVRVGPSR